MTSMFSRFMLLEHSWERALAKNKPEKKKSWKPFSPKIYGETIAGLIHFSAKTVNSNTPAYGVRLGTEDRLDLPYVAVGTMNAASVPADYDKNAGAIATVVAQVSAVIEGRLDEFESVPQADVAAIHAARPLLQTRFELPSSRVGMRLRQVIVQDEDGTDVALTPLQCAGFSAALEKRIDEELNSQPMDERRSRPRGHLDTGGANPQNVGRYVRSMTRPLWFDAPKENMEIRKAIATHFRGVDLRVPAPIISDYNDWRQAQLRAHQGIMPADLDTRTKEVEFLRRMVGAVLDRAAKASTLLDRHLDCLPSGVKTPETMDSVMRGLLDTSLRNNQWERDFAKKMFLEIIDSKVRINGALHGLEIGERESVRWIPIIEGLL